MAGIASTGRLLAAELDPAWAAHGLFVFPPLAGLHSCGRCIGSKPEWYFALETVAAGLRPALCGLGAGVVALRGDQPADRQLGIPGRRRIYRPRVLPALHGFVFHRYACDL